MPSHESDTPESVFEDLLGAWQEAELQVISEFSTTISRDEMELEIAAAGWRERFARSIDGLRDAAS